MVMAFDEAILAPPMAPITVQTSKFGILAAAGNAGEVVWGRFEIEQVVEV